MNIVVPDQPLPSRQAVLFRTSRFSADRPIPCCIIARSKEPIDSIENYVKWKAESFAKDFIRRFPGFQDARWHVEWVETI